MYYDRIACPKCNNRHLRREFAPGPNWTSYKCLEHLCKATFALYEPAPLTADHDKPVRELHAA